MASTSYYALLRCFDNVMSRILGIDPGTRRCGIAITDSAQTMAFPREALASGDRLVTALSELIDQESIGSLVIGRPVALSGNETSSTRLADELYKMLREHLGQLPIIQWDERLTTHQAQRALTEAGKNSKQYRANVDSAAAVIMLQNYLDGQRVD